MLLFVRLEKNKIEILFFIPSNPNINSLNGLEI